MSKIILVVDIETTGFLNQGGKIVEIGIVKLDLETGKITPAYSSLINEPGFDKNHTKEPFGWIFMNSNLSFEEIKFAPTLESQREIIQGLFEEFEATAYNKEFDFGFLINRGFKIKELPCPMILSTPIVNLPSNPGFKQPKWPKVEEAWEFFFGKTGYIEAHRGLDDAIHEAKIVYELYKRGLFKYSEDIKSDYSIERINITNENVNERLPSEKLNNSLENSRLGLEQENDSRTIYKPYRNYHIWGFRDQFGNEISSCKYEPIGKFILGCLLVKLDGKYGFINKYGEEVIPVIYDNASPFSDGLACVKKDGKYGFLNNNNKIVIPFQFYHATQFYEGLASVSKDPFSKSGYINTFGEYEITPKYDYANIFKDGLAAVGFHDTGQGFIDKKGEVIVPLIYESVFYFSKYAVKIKEDGNWAFFNNNGIQLTPFKFKYINDLKDGVAGIGIDGKHGFVNERAEIIIPIIYDNVSSVQHGRVEMKIDGNWKTVHLFNNEK
jgi:DNA polymerase-3 subunit epsilon